jgi:DUF4097 and DUF4098 domain-containing protein YvlB
MKRRNLTTAIGLSLGTLCAFLLLALSAHASPAEENREEFHQTYTLSANGRLDLSNVNGDVHITAWDNNEVKVDAVKHSNDADRVRDTRIVVNANPDSISIETKYERSGWFGNNSPATVDYTIQVPRGAHVDKVNLVNGSIVINGVTGGVRASSVNGSVTADKIGGNIELKTVNSDVRAIVLNPASSIELHSVNGPVSVTIPSDAKADINASTVNGGIDNDFGLYVKKGPYVGRKLMGRLGSGGTRVELKTVNGGISIHHANDGKPLSKATDLIDKGGDREPL